MGNSDNGTSDNGAAVEATAPDESALEAAIADGNHGLAHIIRRHLLGVPSPSPIEVLGSSAALDGSYLEQEG